ncbi:MAG: hypothetical protein KBF48_11265, partial [Xanthomonadales bacterium]|nr:hypothetical protein [Xanthomonadales bacterium]
MNTVLPLTLPAASAGGAPLSAPASAWAELAGLAWPSASAFRAAEVSTSAWAELAGLAWPSASAFREAEVSTSAWAELAGLAWPSASAFREAEVSTSGFCALRSPSVGVETETPPVGGVWLIASSMSTVSVFS